jgi:hypothetical protein
MTQKFVRELIDHLEANGIHARFIGQNRHSAIRVGIGNREATIFCSSSGTHSRRRHAVLQDARRALGMERN